MARVRLLMFGALIILLVQICRGTPEASMVERHTKWMARHGRAYKDDAEKATRLKIFKDNVEYIESFNSAGNRSFKLVLNEFADYKDEEFKATRSNLLHIMVPSPKNDTPFRYANYMDSEVPSSIDWRDKGAVTDVKNQGQCGCCWAFSAVAATEGIIQITTGNLISLSEQQLVDCDTSFSHGCGGGDKRKALEYIINNGLTTESNYPYKASDGSCDTMKASSTAAQITGYENVPANSEAALMAAAANQPVSVSIESSGRDFKFYSSGVFTGECGTSLDHAVTVVGYGEDSSSGYKYWLVKNSWGSQWGEGGYVRMLRDVDAAEGLCGIAIRPSYPIA